jgi:hypothetical protein
VPGVRGTAAYVNRIPGALADLLGGITNRPVYSARDIDGVVGNVCCRTPSGLRRLADGSARLYCLRRRVRQSVRGFGDCTRPYCLLSSAADRPDRLGSCAARTECLLADLADVICQAAHRTPRPDCLLGCLANAGDCGTDRVQQALEDFRVAIDRCQCPVQNGVEILQPYYEQRLGADVLDVEFHLADVNMNASDKLDKVRKPCLQRQMGVQLLYIEVDFADMQVWDVQKDVGFVARGAALCSRSAAGVACALLAPRAAIGGCNRPPIRSVWRPSLARVATPAAVPVPWLAGPAGASGAGLRPRRRPSVHLRRHGNPSPRFGYRKDVPTIVSPPPDLHLRPSIFLDVVLRPVRWGGRCVEPHNLPDNPVRRFGEPEPGAETPDFG